MLEMQHMSTLLFINMWGLKLTSLSLPSWVYSLHKALSSSLLESESASVLFYIQECTDINSSQLSTVWLVTKLLLWKTKFWFSVKCPFLSASSTIFFVADISCTSAWNMLWCPNPEVHICMRHSFISIKSFKHYVSFWSCSSGFETTLNVYWLLHDSKGEHFLHT
jgi:hypothetical protein